MNYTAWATEKLTKVDVTVRGKKVAIWQTPRIEGCSTMLLVHGISGDHYGLVPLVHELARDYNCLIIDLAGHGSSEYLEFKDAVDLQMWFAEAHDLIDATMAPIDIVCAHSFGCTAVVGESNEARQSKTILLNPVPHPSGIYTQYARLVMRFAGFWAAIYNLRAFVVLRSLALAKLHDHQARRNISWVSKYSRPTYRQIIQQARLVDIILDVTSYSHVKDAVDVVICGLDDTLADQRDSLEFGAVFGNSTIVFLRGGHLLPIESPARVASLIRRSL